MIPQAQVGPATDASLAEVRAAAADVVARLSHHLDGLAALPPGPTGDVRLAEIDEPVRHAVARWDAAVLRPTGTLPLAVDDGWSEDLSD